MAGVEGWLGGWVGGCVGGVEGLPVPLWCTWPAGTTEHRLLSLPSPPPQPRALVITCGEEAEWSPRGHLGAAHWC